MAQKSVYSIDSFYSRAKALRNYYESCFADPQQAKAQRFTWDFWHVPGQYRHLRVPAYHFFPKKLYTDFHQYLVLWGRENLGCHDISPTWLSCYVDGCYQSWHGDLPHGPWAFVYSLTPWSSRNFRGGETLLLRDEILDYWRNFSQFQGLESDAILREIAPRFNRLVVFDPRVPHSVREVRGAEDVLDGRLVIHGWFVQPRPFIQGALSAQELQDKIKVWLAQIPRFLSSRAEVSGVLSLRFQVDAYGKVNGIKILSNGLRVLSAHNNEEKILLQKLSATILATAFRRQRSKSCVTLPFQFQVEA